MSPPVSLLLCSRIHKSLPHFTSDQFTLFFLPRYWIQHTRKVSKMADWKLTFNCLNRKTPVPSDIEIVRDHKIKKITQLASEMGLKDDDYSPFGHYVAKINIKPEQVKASRGKYVVITGINPTPLGEGKSTTTIGLAQCLSAHCGKATIACIRQPSQGPTFGIKGGAAGGGYSQVLPMEDFNLHLTGDIHAITAANNLISAAIDARAFHEATQPDGALFSRLVPKNSSFNEMQKKRLAKLSINKDKPSDLTDEEKKRFARLNFDFNTLNWNRVVDINDRFLRKVTVGQSATEKGHERTTQFDISVASELMAILSLCNDMKDAKEKIGKIVVAFSKDEPAVPITCDDLCITGAVTVLLKDAFKPNLVQTLEGSPVFVHAGPFANIAHGNSSVIADKLALNMVGSDGFVLTEAGFGADVGLEKFIHIKSKSSGLYPDAVVIVATVRALKTHGGGPPVTPGAALPKEYSSENIELLEKGLSNLLHHIRTIKNVFGLKLVVAINRFKNDTQRELDLVRSESLKAGADGAEICDNWSLGGEGAVDLAKVIIETVNKPSDRTCKPLYSCDAPIKEKIETIVKKVYGGSGNVEYTAKAEEKIERMTALGFDKLPVCIAKTQYSLSSDANLKGAPANFEKFPIVDIRVSAGAGFIVPLAGAIQTMPGLPTRPAFFNIDIDCETGEIQGLF